MPEIPAHQTAKIHPSLRIPLSENILKVEFACQHKLGAGCLWSPSRCCECFNKEVDEHGRHIIVQRPRELFCRSCLKNHQLEQQIVQNLSKFLRRNEGYEYREDDLIPSVINLQSTTDTAPLPSRRPHDLIPAKSGLVIEQSPLHQPHHRNQRQELLRYTLLVMLVGLMHALQPDMFRHYH